MSCRARTRQGFIRKDAMWFTSTFLITTQAKTILLSALFHPSRENRACWGSLVLRASGTDWASRAKALSSAPFGAPARRTLRHGGEPKSTAAACGAVRLRLRDSLRRKEEGCLGSFRSHKMAALPPSAPSTSLRVSACGLKLQNLAELFWPLRWAGLHLVRSLSCARASTPTRQKTGSSGGPRACSTS